MLMSKPNPMISRFSARPIAASISHPTLRVTFACMGLVAIVLNACQPTREYPVSAGAADEAFKADLTALHGKRIYFGHQSVGKNIMEGLAELIRESGDTVFTLVDLDKGAVPASSGIAHTRIGENTKPKGKCEAFARFLGTAAGEDSSKPRFDIAVLKFCFADVQAATDIDDVLAYYKSTLDSIRQAHPELIILHVTVPLKTGAEGRKEALKRNLGLADANDPANIRRSEFNDKLRSAFAGQPLFDLEKAESTWPDGTREDFRTGGKERFRLIGALSSDEGHLNPLGKRVAAKAFIHALALAAGKPAN
jgi:hypothetical protein